MNSKACCHTWTSSRPLSAAPRVNRPSVVAATQMCIWDSNPFLNKTNCEAWERVKEKLLVCIWRSLVIRRNHSKSEANAPPSESTFGRCGHANPHSRFEALLKETHLSQSMQKDHHQGWRGRFLKHSDASPSRPSEAVRRNTSSAMTVFLRESALRDET